MNPIDQLDESCAFIKSKIKAPPVLAITLGSGLAHFGEQIQDSIRIPFSEIPHFHAPTVSGHGGHLILGRIGEVGVAVLQGRIHFYEGHDMYTVVYPTRTMARLGIRNLVLTNASGGINPQMSPGDFMIIKDHINLTGHNPLRGPNIDELGPRFPDMSEPYDASLRIHLSAALKEAGAKFTEGVYCGVQGPCYETAAEVAYLQKIGGHAVGMSTVAEAIAAKHAGMAVAGLSCITNLATGLSDETLTHDDVKAVAQRSEALFTKALLAFCRRSGPGLR